MVLLKTLLKSGIIIHIFTAMQQQLNFYCCYPSSTSAAVDQETKKRILKSTTDVLLSG